MLGSMRRKSGRFEAGDDIPGMTYRDDPRPRKKLGVCRRTDRGAIGRASRQGSVMQRDGAVMRRRQDRISWR